nr:unnamed protein product [Callosobruchus analis]
MTRYSSSFEKLFTLFGFSMLTRVHARVLFGKSPTPNNCEQCEPPELTTQSSLS